MLSKKNNIIRKENYHAFRTGMRDGIPIGLGYLAVSFSLGIAAQNAGLSPFQGFLVSLLCNASAGEYAGFTLIAADAAFVEVAIITMVANARYLLMSCAMSQRIAPATGILHRLLLSFGLTDELFGIAVARPGSINPTARFLLRRPAGRLGQPLGQLRAMCSQCGLLAR